MNRAESAVAATFFCAALFASPSALAQVSLADGFSKLPRAARIVLMPLDVELFEIGLGGTVEPRADWTAEAAKFLLEGLRGPRAKLGVELIELTDEDDEAIASLKSLHAAVSMAIALHHYGPLKLPTKEGKLDWTLGPDAAILEQKTGAEYALFARVRDHYSSDARQAAMAVTTLLSLGRAPIMAGRQSIHASLVELKSGRILWFNLISRAGKGDLRDRDNAQETLDLLLARFPR